jgi:GNAT superfamily N-acetyltransferase
MRLLLGRFAGIDKRASKRKKAVIIKGNPYYLEQGPDTAGYAAYYKAIEDELRSAGYEDVVYDKGEPMTLPPPADLWVGHSRGASRLRFAPKGTKTLNITEYEDGINEYKAELLREMRKRGYSSVREFPVEERPRPGREHYTLTQRGRAALQKLASVGRDLLIEADKDPGIAGFVRPDSGAERVAFTHKGEVVGFMTPRLDPDGYHRVGAVYVKPEHRGKGIASRNIARYMQGKKSKVWIDDDNVATARAHAKAGYQKGRRAAKDAHWYVKEASAPRDYKREYRLFHSSPEAKRNRAKRNLWNRRLKGKVPAGHEIDHKRQLRDGGGNGRDNIRFLPISKNRAEHNRGNVVRDHMRKESAFKQKRYEVDRNKVRREAQKTNKRLGTTMGVLLGGLAGSKLGRIGVAGGAIGGGLIGRKAGGSLNVSDKTVDQLALMYEREMNQDPLSSLELAARGSGLGGGYAPDREAMRRKFAKTASFDPHQWVYDSLIKQAQAVATKRDPAKWEAAKREAKAKMGGKHSARAMQLATQIYKKKGGTYSGKKPSPSNNKLKKWTKQDWQWSKGDRGVYLPKRSASALNSSKAGRGKLLNAERAKRQATAQGVQFSRHGLHTGKKRSDVS